MTTATSRQFIRRALFDQIPGLGFNATADSLTVTTLTDTFTLRDSTLSQNHYRGMYLYRPDLTTDDRIKRITTLNTVGGVLTHGGSDYIDTTDTNYEIIGPMHPDELNACIQRAMRRIYYEAMVPLTLIEDGDMEATGTTSWTGSAGTTLSKVTTAASVFSGKRSMRVQNDSTEDYAESGAIRVFPTNGGEMVYLSAVVFADVGTAELVLWDNTNSAVVGSKVASAEEGWSHIWLHETIPTNCEYVTVRLRGAEASADVYWNHVVLYRRRANFMDAPTWLDDQHKLLSLRQARYPHTLATASNGGYDDATSRLFSDWLQPSMFTLDPLHLDSHPYRVNFRKPIPREELWVHGKRPYSDTEPLGTDPDTTQAPLPLVYAYALDEIASVLTKRFPSEARWQALRLEAGEDVDAETSSRPTTPFQPIRREHYGRI